MFSPEWFNVSHRKRPISGYKQHMLCFQECGLARAKVNCPGWSIWGAGTASNHGCTNHARKSRTTTAEHRRCSTAKPVCCSWFNVRDKTSATFTVINCYGLFQQIKYMIHLPRFSKLCLISFSLHITSVCPALIPQSSWTFPSLSLVWSWLGVEFSECPHGSSSSQS